MSDAYWRNQRRGKKRPKSVMWACTGCGHDTAFNPPSLFHTHQLRSLDMTTGEIDAFLGKTEPPRDRFGRPIIKTPDGTTKAYTRCTTYVGALEDTFNLGQWQQRMVALGLAQRDDLLMAVGALSAKPEDKTELNRIVDAAREAAAASAGATIGTALHKMCERLDRGEKFLIPTAAKADIEAYRKATEHLRWLHIEEMTVHDAFEVAGTPDRIGGTPDSTPRVYDLKTGSIDYGLAKIAMQLAMYARSHAYDHDTGSRTPLPVDLDVATIIHLPAGEGRCELVDVDIAAGWEGVLLAREVRAWRKRKDFTPPQRTLVNLDDLIALAPDEAALRALWTIHAPTGAWTAEHTALAAARKASLSLAVAS